MPWLHRRNGPPIRNHLSRPLFIGSKKYLNLAYFGSGAVQPGGGDERWSQWNSGAAWSHAPISSIWSTISLSGKFCEPDMWPRIAKNGLHKSDSFLAILGHMSGSQNFPLSEMVDHIVIWVHGTRLHHCFIGTTSHLHRLAGLRHSQNRPNLGILGILDPIKSGRDRWLRIGGPLRLCSQGTNYPTNNQLLGMMAQAAFSELPVKFFFPLLSSFFSDTVYTFYIVICTAPLN